MNVLEPALCLFWTVNAGKIDPNKPKKRTLIENISRTDLKLPYTSSKCTKKLGTKSNIWGWFFHCEMCLTNPLGRGPTCKSA